MEIGQTVAVRTLCVSDVHLGCKHARASRFLDFLRQYTPDSLYLVGDFIDTWKINSGWHWSSDCDEVISHLIRLARQGTKIHYVSGNHDAFLRHPAVALAMPHNLPSFQIASEFVFETLSGHRLLVTHGDLFDYFETRAQWVSRASSWFYDSCLSLNWWFHRFLLEQHQNPYGVCSTLKNRVKRGVRFVSHFESRIMGHAQRRACDGVVCGHIHTPAIVEGESAWYFNTGDWVENCTGLIERHNGQMCLVQTYGEDVVLDLVNSSTTIGKSRNDPNRDVSVGAIPDDFDKSHALPEPEYAA